MRIGYFVERFPELSETFVTSQVLAMHLRGHDIEIDALAPGRGNGDNGCADYSQLTARTQFGETPSAGRLARLVHAAKITAKWMPRAPAAVFECLNPFRYGRQAINLSILQQRLPAHFSDRVYDVVHCHFGPSALRALALREAGALKGPILTTFHGYDANRLPRIYGAGIYRRLFRYGEFFTVGSKFMHERLIALGAPPTKIAILPMGIDLSRFIAPRRTESDGTLRILTVARLSEVKGIDYALLAMRLLCDHKAKIHYRIVGDGPLRNYLEQRARDLDIADIVEFVGAIPYARIADIYAGADVFLLPGIVTASGEEEGQGLVLAEAQASGLPIIATRVGGIPESIREGESGILVEQKNPQSLSRALLNLMGNATAREEMGRYGRTFVSEKFNLDMQMNQLSDIYRSLSAASKV